MEADNKQTAAKKNNTKRLSLRNKVLFLIYLVLFCPIVIITGITISIGYRSLHDSIFHQQREIVSRIADRVSTYLDSNIKLLESIMEMDLGAKKKGEITSLLKDLMKVNSNMLELILVNPKGQEAVKIIREGNRYVTSTNLMDRRKLDEFRVAKQKQKYISQVYLSYQRVPYLIVSRANTTWCSWRRSASRICGSNIGNQGRGQRIRVRVDDKGCWSPTGKRTGAGAHGFFEPARDKGLSWKEKQDYRYLAR